MTSLTPSQRKAWEEANPILAHQEFELNDYITRLRSALALPSLPLNSDSDDEDEDLTPHTTSLLNTIPTPQWTEAERQLLSLESYIKSHPITASRLKATKIDAFLKQLLSALQTLDEVGLDRSTVDEALASRVWGLADKLGSGLTYLLRVDRRWTEASGHARPSTKSVFLLVSAPPATMRFSKDKNEWRTKQLKSIVQYFSDYPPTSAAEEFSEATWSVVWRELLQCKRAVESGFSKENLTQSGIVEMLEEQSGRIKDVAGRAQGKGREMQELGLLYLSWDLVLKLLRHFHGDRVEWES